MITSIIFAIKMLREYYFKQQQDKFKSTCWLSIYTAQVHQSWFTTGLIADKSSRRFIYFDDYSLYQSINDKHDNFYQVMSSILSVIIHEVILFYNCFISVTPNKIIVFGKKVDI